MENSENEKRPPFFNQSNAISNSIYKTESATALKTIKFGMYKLAKLWDDNDLFEKKYSKVDLFDLNNWQKNENYDFSWEDFTCDFSVKEFCDTLKITYGGKQRSEIKKAISKAMNEFIMLSTLEKAEWYPWFVKATYNYDKKVKDKKEIMFVFNPAILAIALGQTEQYTNLELEILGKLKSLYAIRYYEIIKSRYNMKGKKKYGNEDGKWDTALLTIDFIKEYMQIPENAYANRWDNFKSRVIVLPIKEINESCPNLHVEVEYVKVGKKIEGIILHCSEKVITKQISKDDSLATRKQIEEVNNDQIRIQQMKDKYPNEWAEYEIKAKETNKLPFLFGLDFQVFESMEKDGFKI